MYSWEIFNFYKIYYTFSSLLARFLKIHYLGDFECKYKNGTLFRVFVCVCVHARVCMRMLVVFVSSIL